MTELAPYQTLFDWFECHVPWFVKCDLVKYISRYTYILPNDIDINILRDLLTRELGEERPGNIMDEAAEGRLDYFDGEWSIFYNYNRRLIWLGKQQYLDLVVAAQLSSK
jgi:hypothetical protein